MVGVFRQKLQVIQIKFRYIAMTIITACVYVIVMISYPMNSYNCIAVYSDIGTSFKRIYQLLLQC